MDTVINYYDSEEPKLPYQPGSLFLDNGAFTAAMSGKQLVRDRVIEVQEAIGPDRTIPLDYPFSAGMTPEAMARRWAMTTENILYWQGSTSLRRRLVPSLHAWNGDSLISNVRWLERRADADYVAIGSLVVSDFVEFGGFFGDRQPRPALVDMLCRAVESIRTHSDFKIHVMGFGSSPLILHLAYYLGADSTDSAGFRRKAAFGKIVLPGTGERYAGNTSASFGDRKMDSEELSTLRLCSCEICRLNQDALWDNWKARAIHNEHVLKQETRRAESLLAQGHDAYEEYLDTVYARSSLQYLWDYAKLKARYHRISHVLFGR